MITSQHKGGLALQQDSIVLAGAGVALVNLLGSTAATSVGKITQQLLPLQNL